MHFLQNLHRVPLAINSMILALFSSVYSFEGVYTFWDSFWVTQVSVLQNPRYLKYLLWISKTTTLHLLTGQERTCKVPTLPQWTQYKKPYIIKILKADLNLDRLTFNTEQRINVSHLPTCLLPNLIGTN